MDAEAVDRALRRAEDILERHAGSRAALAAKRRKVERAAGELGRRATRAAAAVSASGLGLAGYGLAAGGIGIELLVGAALGLPALGLGVMLIPTRRAPNVKALPTADLKTLAPSAEEWMLRQRRGLPTPACRPADRIIEQLHQLAEPLAALPPGDPRAGEAQRLIGVHLPRLVESYLAVPEAHRRSDPEVERELVNGLGIVADELGRMSTDLAAKQLTDLRVEGRFLQSRYRGEGAGH